MKRTIALGLSMLMALGSFSQSALHLRFRPEQSASSLYQPAYLMWNDSSRFEFGADFFNVLEANTLSRENIFLSGLTLDDELKARIVEDLDQDNRLRLGIGAKALAALRIGDKFPLSISYGIRQEAFAQVPNSQTIALALYGNKHFEGEELKDNRVNARISSFHEIGVGSARKFGNLSLGLRLKSFIGMDAILLEDFNYELFTDTLGTLIDLSGSYRAYRGTGGMGGAIDLGAVLEISPQLTVQASLLDYGFITWNGNTLENGFDIVYEGEEVLDLESFLDAPNLEGANELIEQVLPDTTAGREFVPTNATIHVGLDFALSPSDHLQASFVGSPRIEGPGRPAPILNLAYQRSLYKEIFLGINAFWGGMDGWGIGAMASGSFELGKSQLQVYGQATNLLGLISPSSFGGTAVSFGLGYRLVD